VPDGPHPTGGNPTLDALDGLATAGKRILTLMLVAIFAVVRVAEVVVTYIRKKTI
jgi:hypothetical protein